MLTSNNEGTINAFNIWVEGSGYDRYKLVSLKGSHYLVDFETHKWLMTAPWLKWEFSVNALKITDQQFNMLKYKEENRISGGSSALALGFLPFTKIITKEIIALPPTNNFVILLMAIVFPYLLRLVLSSFERYRMAKFMKVKKIAYTGKILIQKSEWNQNYRKNYIPRMLFGYGLSLMTIFIYFTYPVTSVLILIILPLLILIVISQANSRPFSYMKYCYIENENN
ncbi:MAG: DUF443 family protein [Lactococcus sp.]